MKEQYTKYTCNHCGKVEYESNGVGFPYHKNWAYIHNFTGKLLQSHYPAIETNVGRFEKKDIHLCSKSCMVGWLMDLLIESQKERPESLKIKKVN